MAVNGQKVRELREKMGWSQPELARVTGMSQQAIDLIERGQTKRTKFVMELAHALKAAPVDIDPSYAALAESDVRAAPNASFPPVYQEFPRTGTIPLLGSVVGGPNGRFVLNGQEVGRVFCPPGLEGVDGAYAVRVYGTSMEPRYFAGETVWINPNEPVRAGDFVVAQVYGDDDDTRESYIKQFASRSNKVVRLRQLNPDEGESEDLSFSAEKVFAIHKIVFQASL